MILWFVYKKVRNKENVKRYEVFFNQRYLWSTFAGWVFDPFGAAILAFLTNFIYKKYFWPILITSNKNSLSIWE